MQASRIASDFSQELRLWCFTPLNVCKTKFDGPNFATGLISHSNAGYRSLIRFFSLDSFIVDHGSIFVRSKDRLQEVCFGITTNGFQKSSGFESSISASATERLKTNKRALYEGRGGNCGKAIF